MKKCPQAKIISYNAKNTEVCASAARISTTQGDAAEIFEKANGNAQNQNLIQKVLRSGHRSLIEHATFTIAFWNVSAFVEQYLIECRLASFTVKSRRYVDFSSFGYYTPPELSQEAQAQYCRYMDALFSAYGELLEAGVPKEDARFLLPYGFHSNFYCTVNARELAHIICSIRYGRGQSIPELQALADQLTLQIEEIFPCLMPELERDPSRDHAAGAMPGLFKVQDAPTFIEERDAGGVTLLNAPTDPLGILRASHAAAYPDSPVPFSPEALLASDRPRELEQLSYTFSISDVTLSGITHIVRHRMQSLIIPSIQGIDHSRYIVPATIRNDPELWDRYRSTLTATNGMLQQIAQNPELKKYSYYFAVSGNVMDVMTTINARELKLLIQLRTCRRAQWEIRHIAMDMLRLLRRHFPALYDGFGPSCYVRGQCPEGKLSCGNAGEVVAEFRNLRPEGEG